MENWRSKNSLTLALHWEFYFLHQNQSWWWANPEYFRRFSADIKMIYARFFCARKGWNKIHYSKSRTASREEKQRAIILEAQTQQDGGRGYKLDTT